MEHKDYYNVMGVSPQATEKEIKLAYRRLARKYHPDISKETDAEAHFKEVGEAYEVLKDSQKRQVYDNYLRDLQLNERTRRSGQDSSASQYQSSQSEFDLFESLFGVPPQNRRRSSGIDLHGSMLVSLLEAAQGAVKTIQLPDIKGRVSNGQTLRVKIPAGVKSGQQIRLSGKGNMGQHGGPRGDLYLTIEVEKHPTFDVIDNDIYLILPVTPWEVALGSTVLVPTLGGKVELKIPAGSQGGQKLRLKHRGLPGKVPGDQYVILKLITPKPTTDAARALYEKMAQEMPMDPRADMGV
jgi:curved DNA-binding protein